MDERLKKRGGPLYCLGARSRRFWIAVLVLLPVLYVASFGPYVAFIWATSPPDWFTDSCGAFYTPLSLASHLGPPGIRKCYERYGNWWLDLGKQIGESL